MVEAGDAPSRREYSLFLLLTLTILTALSPFVVLATYDIYSRAREADAVAVRRLTDHVVALTKAVDLELQSKIETAQAVAANQSLRAGDFLAFWETAADISKLAGGHFIITDRAMQQLANTRLAPGTKLPRTASQDLVQQVFASEKTQVGNLAVGAVATEYLFAIRVPVRIDGEVKYVLSFVPDQGTIFKVVQNTFRPDGWFASVIDGNGRIIARSFNNQQYRAQSASRNILSRMTSPSGLLETVDLDGRPALTAYQELSTSNWRFIVWAPKELLGQPAKLAKQTFIWTMALTFFASLVAALVASRLIRAPVLRLLSAARDLGQGQSPSFTATYMKEANIVARTMASAGQIISMREASLREREDQLSIVVKELSHRTKNLISVIQAMAAQSARSAPDLTGFLTRFRGRLAGLAKSHDLLLGRDWDSVPLQDLLKTQLEPFEGDATQAIPMEGPRLLLKPEAAQTIGMAIHELATNATKYGALSHPTGQVEVQWRIDHVESAGDVVTLIWREKDGPPCIQATRTGFGYSVITRIVPLSLSGQAVINWLPNGLEWVLRAPLSSFVSASPAKSPHAGVSAAVGDVTADQTDKNK